MVRDNRLPVADTQLQAAAALAACRTAPALTLNMATAFFLLLAIGLGGGNAALMLQLRKDNVALHQKPVEAAFEVQVCKYQNLICTPCQPG